MIFELSSGFGCNEGRTDLRACGEGIVEAELEIIRAVGLLGRTPV